MTMTETPSSATTAHPRRWQALGLLAVAQFMLILDITVVTVAMPEMGADLGLGRESLTWVMSAYTLAFGGLMLLGGRAADIFGPRRRGARRTRPVHARLARGRPVVDRRARDRAAGSPRAWGPR